MLAAWFREGSILAGGELHYDEGSFSMGGYPVEHEQVVEWDANGDLAWTSEAYENPELFEDIDEDEGDEASEDSHLVDKLTPTTTSARVSSGETMVVAKFRRGSFFEDSRLAYNGKGFSASGVGPVKLDEVIEWDSNGDLSWRSAAVRASALAGEPVLVSTAGGEANIQGERAWTDSVAPASPPEHPTPDSTSPDRDSQPAASAPVLDTWKTSVGFSALGLILNLMILSFVSDVSRSPNGLMVAVIIYILMASYALGAYPSYFSDRPLLQSRSAISFVNTIVGGPLFGLQWNRNLKKGTKGISYIVFSVLIVLAAFLP